MQEGWPRRLGDRVVRRPPRVQAERVHIAPERPQRTRPSPALLLVYGFIFLILLGTLLLALPIASRAPGGTSLLTALFTATSAVCVTGLVVVATAEHWSPFGQAVILALIQVGGLGFMTGATVLFILLGRRVTLRDRMLLQASVGGGTLGKIDRLALQVVVMALAIEGIGVLFLFLRLLAYFDPLTALWQALFYAVSAFNNAGFDITPTGPSLTPYQGDAFILLPMGLLVLLGAISYTVLRDVATVRGFRGLLLDTKLVLVVTAVIVLIGAVVIFFSELDNPAGMGPLPIWEKAMNSLFLSVASRTAGFTTLEIGAMQDYTLFFLIALMFIGGASGSTAGGIKVNTFAVLAVSVLAAFRGRDRPEAFGREIPEDQVRRALTIGALGIIWVHVTLLLLSVLEEIPFIDLFFEAVSAFGINGLSTGITGQLGPVSQGILIASMFVGRLGALTIVLALVQRQQAVRFRRAQERVKIG